MTDVIMPKMGDGMEEGTLVEWLKKEGEKVKSGEVIGTIQTDKATLELEAPSSGVLAGFLIKGGETVPVGRPIAALLKDGEKLPSDWGKGSPSAQPTAGGPAMAPQQPANPEVQAPANAPIEQQQAADANPALPSGASTEAGVTAKSPSIEAAAFAGGGQQQDTGERVKSSPLARRVAQELGVDLGSVQGTGPGGRIVEKDVKEAAHHKPAPAPAGLASAPKVGDQTIQLNRLRQITAQRTAQSKQQAPHFYVTVEVDVERIMALREMFEEEGSGKVSVNDFVIRACTLALQEMPVVNSEFQGQILLQHGSINVGIAVAIEEGLTVPVLKNAQNLSLRQISGAARDLAKKAHENKLSLDELSGSTFAISNMGMLDVDNFSAIIIPPNACIVAISTARKKPIVNDEDDLEIRWRMNITGSFDHRVVDGAVGAKFMNVVRGYLENPTRLLS
jgi:pyruvate dehydrogenase E2 component (dihydrolipoamide acetyltransferase)